MYLNNYTINGYTPGAPLVKQLAWFFLGDFLFRTHLLPMAAFKVFLLRAFGAEIGKGVNIKPNVKVKFPWRLKIGNYVWIGENVWIDNLAPVTIRNNVCISQDVYLCTGNHDWRDPNFQLLTGEIYLEDGSWIAARSVIGPGVKVGQGAILGLGSVASRSLEPMTIYAGNPAQAIKQRNLTSYPHLVSTPTVKNLFGYNSDQK